MPRAKAFRLHEFSASKGNVFAACLGQKSGQFLATGGEDRVVNIWQLGKGNATMSFTGLKTEVDSVTFDPNEQYIVAGSGGGSIMMWELESGKARRFNTGHRSSITCLDFHPFGDFFASGSQDTNLKIWDAKAKSCLQTYHGHQAPIRTVKFTPDGKWVVSGCDNGAVKVWDITAGKLVKEFNTHNGAVTSLDFHPREFLLATGSADKTVRFWDLDQFRLVSSSDIDTTRIQAVRFSPDGNTLLSASTDSLKVWGWEPTTCHDHVQVPWNNIIDLDIRREFNQLFAISVDKSNISVWVVTLARLSPFYQEKSKTSEIYFPEDSHTPPTKEREPVGGVMGPPKVTVNTKSDRPSPQNPKTPINYPKENSESPEISKGMPVSLDESYMPAQRKEPLGLNPQEFLPKTPLEGVSCEGEEDFQMINSMLSKHQDMCSVLSARLSNVRVVRKMWSDGDVKGAIDTLSLLGKSDLSSAVDILAQVMKPEVCQQYLDLDMCVALLPLLVDILSKSRYEEHIQVGLRSAYLLYRSFASVIRTTIDARVDLGVGVDIQKEARLEKCQNCNANFCKIREIAEGFCNQNNNVGNLANSLIQEFGTNIQKPATRGT